MLNEQRGGVFCHVNFLAPPSDPLANAAWIIMEREDTTPMLGSNSIYVTVVLLETGILPIQKPITRLILQTPSSLLSVGVQCAEGKVTQVTMENRPRFAAQLDVTLKVPGLSDLKVDTTFGRDSYVIVDEVDLGFEIQPHETHHIVELGLRITKAANDQLGCNQPVWPDWQHT